MKTVVLFLLFSVSVHAATADHQLELTQALTQTSTSTSTNVSASTETSALYSETPSEVPIDAPFEPKYKAFTGYTFTAIQHSAASHHLAAGLTSIKNEFAEPSARLDYLRQFGKNEVQMTLASSFKNRKKQKLRMGLSVAPKAKIFPQWLGELEGTSAVYGKPVEIAIGLKFNAFSESHSITVSPGFDSYLLYGWIFSGRVLASQVKANSVKNSKWILGYLGKIARYYTDESFYALTVSGDEEDMYNPLSKTYEVVPITKVNLTQQHWVNEFWGFQPTLELRKSGLGIFNNWFVVGANILFKI